MTKLPKNINSGSALSADEISLLKGQEHRVYSCVTLRALQKLRLDARRGDVIDDQPTAWHQARHDQFVNLGIVFRRLDIGKTKRQRLRPAGIVEGVAVKHLDRTVRPGLGDVCPRQSDLLFIEINRGQGDAFGARGKLKP